MAVGLEGGIWSDGAPQAYRTVGVTPAIAILAALPLGLLWRLASDSSTPATSEAGQLRSRFGSYALTGAAALVTLFSLGQAGRLNFDTYFHKQLTNPTVWASFSAAPTIVGHEINRLRPQGYQFFVSTTFDNEPSRIFLNGPSREDVFAFNLGKQIPVRDPRPTAFFHDPLEQPQFLRLRSMYPSGVFKEHRAPGGGEPVLYESILGVDDIRSLMGISAVYTGADGRRVGRLESQVS